MWARVVEFMLALWLVASPFIFKYPKVKIFFWTSDLITSSLIAIFAIVSFYIPLRKIHLANLAVSFYLIALSYIFKGSTFNAPLQNYMVLGLLLLMIALVPSEADKPPMGWRKFFKK